MRNPMSCLLCPRRRGEPSHPSWDRGPLGPVFTLAVVLGVGLGGHHVHAQQEPGAKPPEDKGKADLDLFQGEWRPVRVIYHGVGDGDLSREEAAQFGFKLTFSSNVAIFYRDEMPLGPSYAVTLDPDVSPKAIAFVPTTGRFKGRILFHGAYVLDGDNLLIRYTPLKSKPLTKLDEPPAINEVEWTLERRKD